MPLVLTYDNETLNDGIGSQVQRIYAIYSTARALGFNYLHSPLQRITRYDFDTLRVRECDKHELDTANNLFYLPSDSECTFESIIRKYDITAEEIVSLSHSTAGRRILVKLTLPYGIIDRNPLYYQILRSVSPFQPNRSSAIEIAIHVRRGELPFIIPSRIVPNYYFVNVAHRLSMILNALHLRHNITIFTEATPWDDGGITEREFAGTPIRLMKNGDQLESFRLMAESDVLVLSHSSYSYTAGLLNRRGIVLYNPFWHPPLPNWLCCKSDGAFQVGDFVAAINLLKASKEGRESAATSLPLAQSDCSTTS